MIMTTHIHTITRITILITLMTTGMITITTITPPITRMRTTRA